MINPSFFSAQLMLSPEGHVFLAPSGQASEQLALSDFEKIISFFDKGSAVGLLHLGIQAFDYPLPPSFVFWQNFARQFITQVCRLAPQSEIDTFPSIPAPETDELQEMLESAFLLKGFEYLKIEVLRSLWDHLSDALRQELHHFSGSLQEYLQMHNPSWNLVGRVCFHLAENKNNEEKPFAFLATYTTKLQRAEAQHLPLKRALQDYVGENNKAALLALLLPVQKAASQSALVKELVDSGLLFQALPWSAREAHRFLKDLPLMESSGIVVRIPNWWDKQKPPRPKVMVTVGSEWKGGMGLNGLLDFDVKLALNDQEELTQEEWTSLLNSEENLIKIKGKWIEINRNQLKSILAHWHRIQKGAKNGLTMAESLRLLAGRGSDSWANGNSVDAEATADWSTVVAGDWLKTILDRLKNPASSDDQHADRILNQHLRAVLRPYQLDGVRWLWLLYQLKLGGCLADDMGLGKTIQILAILLLIKHHPNAHSEKKPHLLVVPASLLGNWQAESTRFVPELNFLVAHSSANNSKVTDVKAEQLVGVDFVITTYACISRWEWLKNNKWDLLILDEAQQIKNPDAKQTRAVKGLQSLVRFTLTGTPVENKLGDLWSLFDFTSPGLLGSSQAFTAYAKKAGKDNSYIRFISALRQLTQPYILRRLKNDKKIIDDLPEKTELQSYCFLSKEQIHLYQMAFEELQQQLKEAKGIQRQGLVLSFLTRFKQICNHPAQWLGYGGYTPEASGKFVRLAEICQEISAKQEKVLVFTQFRELTSALSAFLSNIFGREGLVLDGNTTARKRAELVEHFQEERGPPFFVLSLKAGGVGLNLTRASHVIHFDRWWNPAVENQATDRAYRIGQKRQVLVHKFICSGTIEEKIDALISAKKNLSRDILEGENEISLTNMENEELLQLISLDIHKALGDF